MRDFGGAEPLVGEVVGLRTFRLDSSGALLPLHSAGVWSDGVNTASCAPPTGHHGRRGRPAHPVPAEHCECGFYAYGSTAAAGRNRNMRHVQAVVSCWGSVVAGTQGIRAEHARIDAIWLSPRAPDWLRRRVAVRYPSVQVYAEAAAMLAEHPPTALPCYEKRRPARATTTAWTLGLLAVLVLGLLPWSVLHSSTPLWAAWWGATTAVGLLAGWLALGTHTAGHLVAAGVAAALCSWLLAPAFGWSVGLMLRAWPMLGLSRIAIGYLVRFRPRHFPIVDLATPTPRYAPVRV